MSLRLPPNFSLQQNRRPTLTEIQVLFDHWTVGSGRSIQFTPLLEGYKYLVGYDQTKKGFFVVWNGAEAGDLTYEVYTQIVAEAKRAGLESPFYVFAQNEIYQSGRNVTFIKLHRRMLAQIGWIK